MLLLSLLGHAPVDFYFLLVYALIRSCSLSLPEMDFIALLRSTLLQLHVHTQEERGICCEIDLLTVWQCIASGVRSKRFCLC